MYFPSVTLCLLYPQTVPEVLGVKQYCCAVLHLSVYLQAWLSIQFPCVQGSQRTQLAAECVLTSKTVSSRTYLVFAFFFAGLVYGSGDVKLEF